VGTSQNSKGTKSPKKKETHFLPEAGKKNKKTKKHNKNNIYFLSFRAQKNKIKIN
jgi:hypothetical protein